MLFATEPNEPMKDAIDKLFALPDAEKLKLSQLLWESAADKSTLTQTLISAEKHMLDERLAEDHKHPEARVPWSEARADIKAQLDKL